MKEIGASFNGNEIKIRVPKSTYKPPKLTPSQQKLQQTCTCGDDESICSDDCGIPGRRGHGPQNKLNFQIPDDICEGLSNRTGLNSELVYCQKEHHEAMCDICNVTPKDAPKGVKAQKKLHPDKDIFVLKIGKQTDEPNRTGNIEVELVTPRAPAKPRPVPHNCQMVQCEETEIPCCAGCRGCHPRPKRRLRQARCFNLCN
ncbi:hypothetical protein NE865_15421 [Phthorimaea operculella]|nr:hypothetical protein NE865_15421 [Phthorimaea operculella]